MILKTIFQTFDKVAATSSTTEKTKLMQELVSDPEAAKIVERIYQMVYDQFTLYWTTAKPVKNDFNYPHDLDEQALWRVFEKLIQTLASGKVRGNVGKGMIEEFMSYCPISYQHWFSKIINRDLRMGWHQFDKFFPRVRTFNVQLCPEYTPGMKLNFPVLVEPKLDGVRSVIAVGGKESEDKILGRSGKSLSNCDHILDELKTIFCNEAIDGELKSKDFNSTISATSSETKSVGGTCLYAFDIVYYDEFFKEECTETLKARRERLHKAIKSSSCRFVKIVEGVVANNEQELHAAYQRFLDEGYEGAVIKDLNSLYDYSVDERGKEKRSNAWLKLKPAYPADLEIIGFKEGLGKYQGVLGAILVRGKVKKNGEDVTVEAYVGGMTDKMRKDIWSRRSELLGSIVEVKYGDVTTNADGTYSLRFPRFVRLRSDR